jgi:hypothetical protein
MTGKRKHPNRVTAFDKLFKRYINDCRKQIVDVLCKDMARDMVTIVLSYVVVDCTVGIEAYDAYDEEVSLGTVMVNEQLALFDNCIVVRSGRGVHPLLWLHSLPKRWGLLPSIVLHVSVFVEACGSSSDPQTITLLTPALEMGSHHSVPIDLSLIDPLDAFAEPKVDARISAPLGFGASNRWSILIQHLKLTSE